MPHWQESKAVNSPAVFLLLIKNYPKRVIEELVWGEQNGKNNVMLHERNVPGPSLIIKLELS